MKNALLKMGGSEGCNTIYFKRDYGTLSRKKECGNVWVSGDYYDFIHVRVNKISPKDIKVLLKLLGIKSLPARHPLRRVLVRMMIKGQLSVEEFYELVKAQKKTMKPKVEIQKTQKVMERPKGMPNWVPTRNRNGQSIALRSPFIRDKVKELVKEEVNKLRKEKKKSSGLFIGYNGDLYIMNNFKGNISEIKSKITEIYQENEVGQIMTKIKTKMIEEINALSDDERTEERVNEIVSPFMEYKLPRIKIVGINYTKYSAQIGEVITLIHEKDNPHDSKAIAAYNEKGNRFGYVAREQTLSVNNKKNGCISNEEVLELLPHATRVIVEEMHNGFGYAKIQI